METLKVMIDYSEWEKKKAFGEIKEFKVDTKSVKELFETSKQIGRLELGEMGSQNLFRGLWNRHPKAESATDISEAKNIAKKNWLSLWFLK
ncbi:MAG: hypothetical protein U5N58_00415 [Actinomycetota bacterium]|nr:hypothetical protein [Actinomycetota bacterium]